MTMRRRMTWIHLGAVQQWPAVSVLLPLDLMCLPFCGNRFPMLQTVQSMVIEYGSFSRSTVPLQNGICWIICWRVGILVYNNWQTVKYLTRNGIGKRNSVGCILGNFCWNLHSTDARCAGVCQFTAQVTNEDQFFSICSAFANIIMVIFHRGHLSKSSSSSARSANPIMVPADPSRVGGGERAILIEIINKTGSLLRGLGTMRLFSSYISIVYTASVSKDES